MRRVSFLFFLCIVTLSASHHANAERILLEELTDASKQLTSPYLPVSKIQIQARLTQGGIFRAYLPDIANVRFNEAPIEVSKDGYFLIGFGRDEHNLLTLSWDEGDKQFELPVRVKKREYNTQYIEGVPQKTVTPDQSKLDRIRKETASVKEARRQHLELEHFKSSFQLPVEGIVTGVYGSQRVYNGVPKRPHYGIDYAAPTGTIVVAPASAVITLAHDDMYYSGGTLIMDHGLGLSSTFIHLSEILVKPGDAVKAGEPVAKVGAGGRATGPHLDWRMNWYNKARMDPQLIMELDAIFE